MNSKTFYDRIMNKPMLVLCCLVILQFMSHLPVFNLPPLGQHVWRQVVGHSMAYNYFLEGSSFFDTLVDIRLGPDDLGSIYHEFPLTYWLVSKAYQFWGVHDFFARFVPFLFNILLVFSSYFFAKGFGYSTRRSLWFTFFVSSSPLFFYYSASLVPNMLGLSFFMSGLAFFLHASQKGKWCPEIFCATLFITLGTLSKPTYLFFGLPLAYLLIKKVISEGKKAFLTPCLFMGSTVLIANSWTVLHAKKLYEASPLERAIHTPIGPADFIWDVPTSLIMKNLETGFTSWLFEMIIGNAALPFFLTGLFLVWKNRSQSSLSKPFWMCWSLSFFIYSLFFVTRFADHDYYLTSLLPLVAFVSAKGADHLSNKAWMKRAGIGIALVVFTLGFTRVSGRWFRHVQVPQTLLETSNEVNKYIPENELVLIQGDNSPNVYLYFLRRKGLSLNAAQDQDLSSINAHAFKWLVHNTSAGELNPSLKRLYSREKIASYNEFDIYRLQPHEIAKSL